MNEAKKIELTQKLQSLKEFSQKITVADKQDLTDLLDEMIVGYPEQLYKAVDRGKKMIPDSTRDFFICSAIKREPFNPKIFKIHYFWTFECPRPYVNFTVFKYHRKTDELELIWCIPDRETLNYYYNNRHLASPNDYTILKYCIEYKDGTLYRKMQNLNNESPDKPSLIVHDLTPFKDSVTKGEA